jgi:hypothetical protein
MVATRYRWNRSILRSPPRAHNSFRSASLSSWLVTNATPFGLCLSAAATSSFSLDLIVFKSCCPRGKYTAQVHGSPFLVQCPSRPPSGRRGGETDRCPCISRHRGLGQPNTPTESGPASNPRGGFVFRRHPRLRRPAMPQRVQSECGRSRRLAVRFPLEELKRQVLASRSHRTNAHRRNPRLADRTPTCRGFVTSR